MAIAIDIKTVHDYVLKEEQGLSDNDQTVFQIRTLTAAQSMRIMGLMNPYRKKINQPKKLTDSEIGELGKVVQEICRIGLCGWKNFKSRDNKQIPFKKENIDYLQFSHQQELMNAIFEFNKVKESDSKN